MEYRGTSTPILRWARGVGFLLAALLLGAPPTSSEEFTSSEWANRGSAIELELAQVKAVIARAGGWRDWSEILAPCHADIASTIETAEKDDQAVFTGPEGDLFTTALTRFALAYNVPPFDGGDVDIRTTSGYTAVVDLSQQLEKRGIHVLFVPIPQKEEIYPRSISALAPEGVPIYPQRYLYMEALLEAGVEVVDLLPALQTASENAATPLYPKTDLHWGNRAMGVGAEVIAARLRRFSFPQRAEDEAFRAERFHLEETGPLVKYFLPEARWADYPHLVDEGLKVLLPDGQPYKYDHFEAGPVLMIGDSFMMRSRVGGSWSARLALEIGVPVTGYMENQKGAQSAARILARKGTEFYQERRVIVWYVVGGMLSRTWFAQALPK